MKLIAYCQTCQNKNTVKKRASDRYKLSQRIGEKFDLKCPKCSTSNHFSVNDVSAENGITGFISFLFALVAIAVGFIFLKRYFSISTWWLIPALISIPVSFYAISSKEENNRIRAFNRYKIKS